MNLRVWTQPEVAGPVAVLVGVLLAAWALDHWWQTHHIRV